MGEVMNVSEAPKRPLSEEEEEERARDGIVPREGDRWPARYGRHAIVLALCWDDWEGGAREHVQKQMSRQG